MFTGTRGADVTSPTSRAFNPNALESYRQSRTSVCVPRVFLCRIPKLINVEEAQKKIALIPRTVMHTQPVEHMKTPEFINSSNLMKPA